MPRYNQGGAVKDEPSHPDREPELRHRSETSADFQQGHDDVAAPLSEVHSQAADVLNKARSTLGDGMQTASDTYDDTASSVSSTYSSAANTLDDNLQHASNLVESGMQQTADTVKMGAAWTMALSGWASDRSYVRSSRGCWSSTLYDISASRPEPWLTTHSTCLQHAWHCSACITIV